jgi:hypothetical protein
MQHAAIIEFPNNYRSIESHMSLLTTGDILTGSRNGDD